MEILDAYKQFFKFYSKDDLFTFGLDNIISIDKQKAVIEWNKLKSNINNKSANLYVRSSGRNASGNSILQQLYKDVFELNIRFDPTNNAKPTKLLEDNTGYKKNLTIFNYQVSHVFGQTKNVYCFTAPWNIVFIPKIIDPFTGHEAKGDYVDEFKNLFKNHIYKLYKELIDEYNEITNDYRIKVEKWLNSHLDSMDIDTYLKDFNYIDI
ncbi:hypothetical protein DWB79_06175 [Treponema medium]|uniref:Uncharacterized protein n=3 Tax=Treponema medium TaxID=58231 RepID=A0AA87NMH7_TREMD|nr:hypothetical protein [Treponema medium]EPF28976.1 hypothetical protein HMPREF9195_01218 [Treponema medium ATCC 700293]QSH97339.1 hypothetical protein DWB79_06175 [Treponema medium]